MKRARFTEEQIIGVLKEHEAGAKTADLAHKHGVAEAMLYNWKAKYERTSAGGRQLPPCRGCAAGGMVRYDVFNDPESAEGSRRAAQAADRGRG